MYAMKHKSLALFVGALLFFAACKKDSDKTYEPPVTEPLTAAAAKPGDTLIIKGSNFSTTATENTVEFNGVAGTVVSASATEIKVIIPANATSGSVTVTVHGNKTEVGSLVISQFTLYCIKGIFSGNTSLWQLVSINPENGAEALVVTINETGDKVEDAVYWPATNEIIGRDEDGKNLIAINVTTKKVTKVPVASGNIGFHDMVVDKNNNLYAIKLNYTDPNHSIQSLVKFDAKTGVPATIKTFEFNDDLESMVYVPANNEIVGLAGEGTKLFKFNLTTKDTSTVGLANTNVVEYRELFTDDQGNLYGYKANYSDPSNYVAQVQKLNPANGQQSLVSDLKVNKFHDNVIYNPKLKEIVSVSDQISLYRLNINTKAATSITLAGANNAIYNTLISN